MLSDPKTTQSFALVTGATGLVGRHLLFKLLEEGKKVRALIRTEKSKEKVLETFNYYSKEPLVLIEKIEWVIGDITEPYSLALAFEGITDVYHCAAFVSFARGAYSQMCKINIEGTRNIVNACQKFGVRKLLHVSSIAAIGKPKKGIIYDETGGFSEGEISPYAYTKTEAEKEVWMGIENGLSAVIINPAVIIGPGDWNNGSGRFFPLIASGLKFYTGGSTSFVGVKDVVAIMVKLMDHSVQGERYILSSEHLTYKAFFTMIANALRISPPRFLARKWMGAIAWRVEGVLSTLQKPEPGITKWSVKAGQVHQKYLSTKIEKQISFKFWPMSEVIWETAGYFQKKQGLLKS